MTKKVLSTRWRLPLPCAHPTVFSQISLFLNRFSREFWVSNKPYKSDSKNRRLEDSISDVLIVFTFFLSYYGCARIRNHTSIFAGKSAQSNAQNWCRAKQPRLARLQICYTLIAQGGRSSSCEYFCLVYTKTVDSVFRALWLATQSVNIQC